MLAQQQLHKAAAERSANKSVKCVVWDLDNTIWDGVLLEDQQVTLRTGVLEALRELDRRGILNSIASRNDAELALAKLDELGIKDYFLYPEIGWNPKSEGLRQIAASINIGVDTLAFVDDQPFERAEVHHSLPQVRVFDAEDVEGLLHRPELQPRFLTSESSMRRKLYLGDIAREQAQAEFVGTDAAFLATLGMTFTIKSAEIEDLQRAEELTQRTHQLNTTGYTYSFDELDVLRQSDNHLLLVANLEDKFGPYGTIGLALVELCAEVWTLKLLLMSCRVMSRGVGTVMLSHITMRAKDSGARLRGLYIPNSVNRMMEITYRLAGFGVVAREGDLVVLEHDLSRIQPFPDYVRVVLPDPGPRTKD